LIAIFRVADDAATKEGDPNASLLCFSRIVGDAESVLSVGVCH
jgi:hypothetical protein